MIEGNKSKSEFTYKVNKKLNKEKLVFESLKMLENL